MLICVLSYLIGSLNSAIIATYLVARKDVREFGSKNAGLTNVYRIFGKTAACLTLLFDFLKGFIAVFIANLPFIFGIISKDEYDSMILSLAAAIFIILGHSFPIFYEFKGGKGILLAAVCMLATDPVVFLCEFIVFFALVALTRYISVGSIACCIGYPLFTLLWQGFISQFFGIEYQNVLIHTLLTLVMGIICFLRHMPNVKRLLNHEENKFKFRKD